MSKLPFLLLPTLLASTSALAFSPDQCTAQPSCESMGYSKSIKTNCSQMIKCPFDITYKLCLDCSDTPTPSSCPEDAVRMSLGACFNSDGIPLKDGYNSDQDVCCKTCPDSYRKIAVSSLKGADFLTCNSTVYHDITGPSYQCCTGQCPRGTITKKECQDKGGKFQQAYKINSNGQSQYADYNEADCVSCVTCPDDYTFTKLSDTTNKKCDNKTYHINGGDEYKCCQTKCSDGQTYTGHGNNTGFITDKNGNKTPIPQGYGCYYLEQAQKLAESTICCQPCKCSNGKIIYSEDDITGPGSYCVAKNITIAKDLLGGSDSSRYIFNKSDNCSGSLRINSSYVNYVTSNIFTTVNVGSAQSISLTAGGKVNRPFGGSLSISLTQGVYNLNGAENYGANTNVNCSGVGGSETGGYLNFGSQNSWTIYAFKLGSQCKQKPCQTSGKWGTMQQNSANIWTCKPNN